MILPGMLAPAGLQRGNAPPDYMGVDTGCLRREGPVRRTYPDPRKHARPLVACSAKFGATLQE
jgi:hypothetical protein